MRTGAPAGSNGYFHETALYGSDAELLDLVVPFVLDGLAAGEPTIAAFAPPNTRLLEDQLGPSSGVTFLPNPDVYARPAVAIRTYLELFGSLLADGATQIRVVGDVPHPGTGARWEQWLRYEGAVNGAFAPLPVWGLCPYDTRSAPDDVIEGVLAAHPHIAGVDGRHEPNPSFVDPAHLLDGRETYEPDPLQLEEPMAVLLAPSSADGRGAAREAARAAGLDEAPTDDLLLVVSELITNADLHGRPPVTLELWVTDGRVVVAVSDAGAGPGDPYVGLLRPDRAIGGLGLWLAHQVCDELQLLRRPTGFTVRAAIGRPPAG